MECPGVNHIAPQGQAKSALTQESVSSRGGRGGKTLSLFLPQPIPDIEHASQRLFLALNTDRQFLDFLSTTQIDTFKLLIAHKMPELTYIPPHFS